LQKQPQEGVACVCDLKTRKPPFGGFGIHRSVVKNISAARLSVKVAAQIFEKTTAR
jgi:hypothetical protein